jgi:serine/threonine protein kinase
MKIESDNVVRLHDIVYMKNETGLNPVLVFDYFEHDFFGILMKKVKYNLNHIKLIFRQIVQGLTDMHERNIFHCDIKPANILLNNKGQVSIADLGLSMQLKDKNTRLHKPSTTILYRSPEQLFKLSDGFGLPSDVWGLGCILAELLIGQPLFMAKNFQHLIELFMARFGRDISSCEKFISSSFFNKHKHKLDPNSDMVSYLKKKNSNLDYNTLDLLNLLLQIDPEKRIKLENILQHSFFSDEPLPASFEEMPQIEKHCHEYTVRLEHENKKKNILNLKDALLEKKQFNQINCLDSQNASTGISLIQPSNKKIKLN